MDDELFLPDRLAEAIAAVDASGGPEALPDVLSTIMPGFELVMTRGHWYRLGGVVDGDYQRVSDSIAKWAEEASDGDIDELIATHMDSGYFATRLSGRTHYLTAPCGEGAADFVQLEVEQLQEVLDRPLVDRDWYPDSMEEFVDPIDYPRLEPEPIGKPMFRFRRVTWIDNLLNDDGAPDRGQRDLRRFFADWDASSAHEAGFCRHWVLALREYTDRDGSVRLSAKPLSTFAEELPQLPSGESLSGANLANALHAYDREMGFPFAWFFMMLSHKASNYTLADAVLRDQIGAYDYLPARDLKVLRDWEVRPYAV